MMRPPRSRLTSKQREALYDAECVRASEAGRGEHPICNICGCQIVPPQAWHESHDPLLPRALGGAVTGIAHDRCNLRHARQHDARLIAKNDRVRQKHIGAHVPAPSSRPLLGTRRSGIKLPLRGGAPIDRTTGQPWRPR